MKATAQFPPYTRRCGDASAASQPIVVALRAPAVDADRAMPVPVATPHVLHIDRDCAGVYLAKPCTSPRLLGIPTPTVAGD